MTEPSSPEPRTPDELGFERIVYEKAPPRATITLNRPERLNALRLPMLRELARACEDASWDDEIRVVVLTGAGRAFCVGADLKEWSAEYLGNPQGYWKWFGAFQDAHDRLREIGKPTLARINGDLRRRRKRVPDGLRPRGDGRRRLHPPRRARARLGARRRRDAVAADHGGGAARARDRLALRGDLRAAGAGVGAREPRRPGRRARRDGGRARREARGEAPADDALREAPAELLARPLLARRPSGTRATGWRSACSERRRRAPSSGSWRSDDA